MRKIFFTLLAAGATLVACQKETDMKLEPVLHGDTLTINLTASQSDATKTVLNGTDAKWAEGDKVTVMYKKSGESTWSTAESSAAATSDEYDTATFEATLTTPDAGENAYAIYPANNLSQTVADQAKITIAATQHPTGTGFDGGSDIMISKPFTPSTDPIATQFARANAVLKIKINNATLASEKLVSLSVEGDNDLAGDVLVGLSDHAVKGIENGSHTVTAEYATANQFELGAAGKYVYLIVKPQTLASGSTLSISGVTRNYTFSKDIVLSQDIHLSAGHIMPLNITITSTTLTAKKDVLTYTLIEPAMVDPGSGSYWAWTGVSYAGTDHSTAVYAGQSNHGVDYIQIRATSPSGIVSTTSGGAISKIAVSYNTTNTISNGRKINIYGKNSAYSGSVDLNGSDDDKGDLIGTITYKTGDSAGYLIIDDYYEYIGIIPNGAIYLDNIDLYWGVAKTPTGLVWKKSGVKATTDAAEMRTGGYTMPTIALDNPNGLSVTYASSDPSVATINSSSGAITLVAAGETIISASYDGDATYKSDEQSYTLSVSDSRTTPVITLTTTDVDLTDQNYNTFTGRSATVDQDVTLVYSKVDVSGIIDAFNTSTGVLSLSGNTGTATVTVSFAGNADYKPAESKSYTINVASSSGPEKRTAPGSPAITAISSTSFTATWAAPATGGSENGYSWKLSTSNNPADAAITNGTGNVDTGVLTVTVSSGITLTSGQNYYFHVLTRGDGGVSYNDSDYATSSAKQFKEYEVTWNSTNNEKGVTSYSNTWYVEANGFRLNMSNWNNNNNGWSYVKGGAKASSAGTAVSTTCTMTTNSSVSEAISHVIVNYTQISCSKAKNKVTYYGTISSAKLEVSTSSSFASIAETVNGVPTSTGEYSYDIETPIENAYYRLTVVTSNESEQNGVVAISSVVFSNASN